MFKFKYCIFLLASPSLYALTTLAVTISTDNNPGGIGEIGDLRYCLNSMNQNLSTAVDDYNIVFDHPMIIQLNGILPLVNNSANPVNITIGNSDPALMVTIDGNNAYSGFFIPMGNVTIQNMNFQNLIAKGGNGGNGISGGGGGLGAGGAIYAPHTFLNGFNPSITLKNVSISNCSAIGGNGGSYLDGSTGNEGGGGGGGFGGNGGSITTTGITGGAGGGGFGGQGGDVTMSFDDPSGNGGGGGGGGGLGSLATLGVLTNLGNGGSDQGFGLDGNGYGLTIIAGSGGGGTTGGSNAGGGGGGAGLSSPGGGGGGSNGSDGMQPQGNVPPLTSKIAEAAPSGGIGGDGGGGGGGGIVLTGTTNEIDGQAGNGGYGGGGGGGAGTGAYDMDYTVKAGSGGLGGGGGGGGVNQSGTTSAEGGNSLGGGGGGGGGPSNASMAMGGIDLGKLGGGAGGTGANTYGAGGGGGGGGSGLGAAVFVDSELNFTIQALQGIPTYFDTTNNTTQAGSGGTSGPDGSDGLPGSALGNSIFLRSLSTLTFLAQEANDLLILGDQVTFSDDTSFGGEGTSVFIKGNGSVIYQGIMDYQGTILITNANFKVTGQISQAPIFVNRDINFGLQRGTLSGNGILGGDVIVDSGTIYPDTGATLTLGNLTLNSAAGGGLGSLVRTTINSSGTSLVSVNGAASLAGTLEINLDSSALPGHYTLLTSSGITGTFNSISFTGRTPNYTLSYLPVNAPTYVQFNFLGYSSPVNISATVNGSPIINPAVVCCGRPVILGPLQVPGTGPTTYSIINHTGHVTCRIGQTSSQTYLKMHGKQGSCTIIATKNGIVSNPLTVIAP